eukprot:1156647-Pelagomonas_calceolata.AAC.22
MAADVQGSCGCWQAPGSRYSTRVYKLMCIMGDLLVWVHIGMRAMLDDAGKGELANALGAAARAVPQDVSARCIKEHKDSSSSRTPKEHFFGFENDALDWMSLGHAIRAPKQRGLPELSCCSASNKRNWDTNKYKAKIATGVHQQC